MKVNDKKVVVYALAFSLLFMLIVVPLLSKGTQSAEEDTDALTLSCPDTAVGGEEIECRISLNSSSIITQGLTIKYGLPEGMEYVEFTTDNFEVYSNDENGLVLVNLDGVSGDALVGNLKLKMPTDALANVIYTVELVDSTIGDGADTVIELEDVTDEIRIKSDINTLDSITLSSGELNETFDKDNLEYTVTTDLDNITISGKATDDKATVSGDVGAEKALHYGTNEFNIVVTSEDGIVRTYKISVFRTYEFSTDKYLYNKEDNYIYVGTDIDNLLNNISVASELTKNIGDDKLVISYENEKVLEIDILSVNFSKYALVDNTLYVDKEYSSEEFSSNVVYSEGITFDLSESGKIKILYGDVELDSYDMIIYNLEFDSSVILDEVNKYIKYLSLNTTVSELLEKINVVGGTPYIYSKDGSVKESDDVIFTGDKLVVYLGDTLMDEYMLSVVGDSSGDGRLSTIDLAQIRKHLVDWVNPNTGIEFELSGVYSVALDLNKDGRVSVGDLALMRRRIVG